MEDKDEQGFSLFLTDWRSRLHSWRKYVLLKFPAATSGDQTPSFWNKNGMKIWDTEAFTNLMFNLK